LALKLLSAWRGDHDDMQSGFYAALTGLVAKFDALDLVANNFANLNTTGYKGQNEFYRSVAAAMGNPSLSPLNQAVNNYGVLGGAVTDMQTGPIQPTGNPLDIALAGQGFLVAKTAAGDRYTRNGSLHLNRDKVLVTTQGDPVMGLVPKPKGKPGEGPIKLPEGQISISPGGVISVNGAIAGQLKLVQFPQGTQMAMQGNGYYTAPAAAEQTATDPQVRQGSLESSNVNPMTQMVSLVLLQRQTQMLQNAITTFDKTFDQTAINNIPIIQ
ncbi:MAG TPA: flagellar hook basal-body protein, partial [Terriglobia bacterium]|nr:flagellar hook basal-body protein [Terriglobia bacterium]